MSPPELSLIEGVHRRDEPARWWLPTTIAVGLVAVVTGVITTLSVGQVEDDVQAVTVQRNAAATERDAAAGQASSLAERVVAACEAGGESAAQLERVGACQQAQQVRAVPVPTPAPITERVRPPTVEELRAAVDAYMSANPPPQDETGRSATPDEVAAAVAEFMAANPPAPGRTPTAEEISDAVALYFATNPVRDGRDGEAGQPGASGIPGRPPTEEEIQAAVATYLRDHPIDTDMTCPSGASLQDVEFASGETGLGCVTGDAPPDPPADEERPPPVADPSAEQSAAPTSAPETESE